MPSASIEHLPVIARGGLVKRVLSWAASHREPLILACAAICLYGCGIGWGLPASHQADEHVWSRDDHVPLASVRELYITITHNRGRHNLYYPMFQYMLVGVAYTPYLLLVFLTGSWPHPSADFPHGWPDPAHTLRVLTLLGRSVTVLMGAGTVVGVYFIANTLWDRTRAVIAGLIVLLTYPMFYYGRTGNLDVPALFWATLGLLAYARMVRFGVTVRRAVALGVFAAAAAGTKDQYAALFIVMPLMLFALRRTNTSGDTQAAVYKAIAWLIGAGVLAYSFTSGFLLWPQRYLDHVKFVMGMRPDSPVYFGHPSTLSGYFAAGWDFITMLSGAVSAPILIAAVAGALIMPLRPRLLLLAPLATYIVFVIAPLRLTYMRSLLPVALFVALFAAYVIGAGLASNRRVVRNAALVLIACGLFVLTLYDADLTNGMLRDSRYAAADWLDRSYAAGARIGYFGPEGKLPRPETKFQFERLLPFRGTDPSRRFSVKEVDTMAQTVRASAAKAVLVIPEHWTPDQPYGTSCPVGLFERLKDGSIGFQHAVHFQTPPLLRWLERPPLDYPTVNPAVHVFVRNRRME